MKTTNLVIFVRNRMKKEKKRDCKTINRIFRTFPAALTTAKHMKVLNLI